ncbi:MAG TPA: tRNA (adenosine(37)-N6)-threonylcarbamoyltransferase complex transferase subunit TsaD [Bacilli bacterium]|nr:tRNA (adenosine(37)-N6)-threonylcarbamoyltransferase complex transferase subunit TsaD [Bacilli bacterium]
MSTILAIESSCDETGVAIVRDGNLLCNIVSTQIEVHQKYGGVMPEIASRLHAENIGVCLQEALQKSGVKLEEVDAFAVTRGPGLIGALHVGLQAAKTLAMLYQKPLIPVHHLAAHIYANEYVAPMVFPLLAVVVSGGNSELVIMRDHLNFEIIGETKDDAVGECYDKVARVLGLPYPGGIPIDRLASTAEPIYSLPNPLHNGNTYDLSYSGLKTHIINLVNMAKMKGETIDVPGMCASFQKVAIGQIIDKSVRAAREYQVKQVVLAGGVSANSYLRSQLPEELKADNIPVIRPPMWCCTDQAAMIAKLAERLYTEHIFAPLTLGVDPNWPIDHFRDF